MLTSQKKSTRAIASNDKMPDMMVLLYQKQCLKNFQGIQELFNNPGLANYSTVYIKQYVENDWMTLYGTETSKYTKWILPMRYYPKYFLRTGPTTKWIQSTKYGLQYIVVVYWHKAHSPQLLVLSRLSVYTLMPTSNCFPFSSSTMYDAFVRPSADALFTKS